MGMLPPKKKVRISSEEPERPTHFGEDQNERVNSDDAEIPEYMTEVSEHPAAMGFMAPPEALPMYLVEAPPTNLPFIRHSCEQFTITAGQESQEIAGADRSRTQLTLHNCSAADVIYILSEDGTNTATRGFPLMPGKELVQHHTSKVWAWSSANAPILGVASEHDLNSI